MNKYQIVFLIACLSPMNNIFTMDMDQATSSTDKKSSRIIFPLFSLGQNIIGKQRTIIGTTIFAPYWKTAHDVYCSPAILYGISDTFSVQLFMPATAYTECDGTTYHGLGDIVAGWEWAYYAKTKAETYTQATIFNQIKIPVSSNVPYLTSGAVDIILGSTISTNTSALYAFSSIGLIIPTWHNHVRKGYHFCYEFGIGPIFHKTDNSLLSAFLEIDGMYTTSDIDNPYPCTLTLKNNVVFIGPVFFWSFKNCIMQFGIQAPLTQSFEQLSDKRNMRVGALLGFRF